MVALPANFAARRMLVSTIAITVAFAIGIVAWQTFHDDGQSAHGAGADWTRLALVDRTTGVVTYRDAEGVVIGSTDPVGRVDEVYTHDARLALIGPTEIVLQSGIEDPPTIVEIERNATVTPFETADSFHLVVGRATGGDVVIVDALTGDAVDVGNLTGQPDPLMFVGTIRQSADGSAFAIADAAAFRTVVVRADDVVPHYFGDQPLAVGPDRVVTSQLIDREADVTISDLDRAPQGLGTVGIPAGAVLRGHDAIVVTTDGTVYRIANGKQAAQRLGSLDVPGGGTVRWVRPSMAGERLVIGGDVFQAVIQLDGTTVFTTTFDAPVDLPTPASDWTCLPTGADGVDRSIVSLDTGDILASMPGQTVAATAADGCAVISERSGVFELVTTEGTVRLGRLRSVALAPDGRSIVWTTPTGRTELVRVDGDLALSDPIELVGAPRNLAVVFLLDR